MKEYLCMSTGIVGAMFTSLFGGWNEAIAALLIFMAVDYITGLIVAGFFKNSDKTNSGGLSSAVGIKGLFRKGGMLLVVLVAYQLDRVIGSTFVRDTAVIAFIANETISIIENAGLMGVPIPRVIKKAIDVLKEKSGEDNDEKNSSRTD